MKLTIRKYGIEIFLSLCIILVLFYKLGYMPLSADEPIRALIAADMAYNGNYIAPKLNGEVYLNKPPLYNWFLLAFFKISGSFSEFVVRLPSILSLIAWGYILIRIVKRELDDTRLGFIVAMAFIASGNLWIYSSYLGHIDVTYSLVTFIQLYALYAFSKKGQWFKAFLYSYLLAATGFMMKGLPSIVFQGISIFVLLISTRNVKRLWSGQHILAGLSFFVPIGVYLWAFSRHFPLSEFLERLVSESTSRTITDKSIWESINHLFVFPFQYLVDIMPWGLSVLIFLRKDARKLVWENQFLKMCILLFLSNIVVYWLSPDYRARYVFMLTPFLLIPSLYAVLRLVNPKRPKVVNILIAFLGLGGIMGLILSGLDKLSIASPNTEEIRLLFYLIMLTLLISRIRKTKVYTPHLLLLILVLFRYEYTQSIVPLRVSTGPYLQEKVEGQKIGELTKGEDLAMYHSNVSLTMNWYITIYREETLGTETKNHRLQSYYLVPAEVIKDTTNIDTYFTFVRRFERKPFSLVKFKRYFPKMPKKKN